MGDLGRRPMPHDVLGRHWFDPEDLRPRCVSEDRDPPYDGIPVTQTVVVNPPQFIVRIFRRLVRTIGECPQYIPHGPLLRNHQNTCHQHPKNDMFKKEGRIRKGKEGQIHEGSLL